VGHQGLSEGAVDEDVLAADVAGVVGEQEGDDAADVAPLAGWRRELFGDNALKLKRGEIALRLEGRRVSIVAGGTAEGRM